MKGADVSLQDWSDPDPHLSSWFEKAWRELDAHEALEATSDFGYRNIELECNGELADIAAVALVGLRESPQGLELIEFVCPRCDQHHESRRFR